MKRIHTISGIVILGDGLGKKYGYPTANIKCGNLPSELKDGIYASLIYFRKKKYLGLLILGDVNRKQPVEKKIELHVLDFTGNLYNQELTAEVIKKIRSFKQFESAKELIRQIENDCLQARAILSSA